MEGRSGVRAKDGCIWKEWLKLSHVEYCSDLKKCGDELLEDGWGFGCGGCSGDAFGRSDLLCNDGVGHVSEFLYLRFSFRRDLVSWTRIAI
jgi:hypothetical protein